MGTRADFYVGTGPSAEWLGSIAWDGYPDGWPDSVLPASTEADFRARVESLLSNADGGPIRPERGWPWPWEDSRTTDYAYAWRSGADTSGMAEGEVVLSSFGRRWETLAEFKRRHDDDDDDIPELTDAEVRNMSERQMPAGEMLGASGLIVLKAHR